MSGEFVRSTHLRQVQEAGHDRDSGQREVEGGGAAGREEAVSSVGSWRFFHFTLVTTY